LTRTRIRIFVPPITKPRSAQSSIDPLFEALGWDVANRQGFAEAYKEVIHEDAGQNRFRDKGP